MAQRTSYSGEAVPPPDVAPRPDHGASGAGLPGLGVGQIVGESFSIFFRRIHWFALLAFVPQLIAGLLLVPMVGGLAGYAGLLAGDVDPDAFARGGPALFVVTAISLVLTMLIPQALSVLAAYDAKLGRRFDLGRYVSAGLRPIVPLLVCWLVVLLMSAIASTLFLLPGLWLLAAFAVVVPAIVVEGAGFGGLGRSIGLTKGFRWPILGTMIVIVMLTMLLGAVVSLVTLSVQAALLPASPGGDAATGVLALVAGIVLQSLNTALIYGLPCVGIALIYARLREIKEGTGIENLSAVFA